LTPRPLTFRDLEAEMVHVFPERDGVVALGLVTASGTVSICLPPGLARELAEGLSWLISQQQAA
jgi:hypothetical protein